MLQPRRAGPGVALPSEPRASSSRTKVPALARAHAAVTVRLPVRGPSGDLVAISTTVPAGNHPRDSPDPLRTPPLPSRDCVCTSGAMQSPSPVGTPGPDTDSGGGRHRCGCHYRIRRPCQSRTCTRRPPTAFPAGWPRGWTLGPNSPSPASPASALRAPLNSPGGCRQAGPSLRSAHLLPLPPLADASPSGLRPGLTPRSPAPVRTAARAAPGGLAALRPGQLLTPASLHLRGQLSTGSCAAPAAFRAAGRTVPLCLCR